MKLTKQDIDKLWGEEGPYSQVHLITETRILDDRVSRIFVIVEVYINPFTFEIVRKNRKLFKNDLMIQRLLNYSEYRGQAFGYVSCVFQEEYIDKSVMDEAKRCLEDCKQTIIKLHKFVINLLNEEVVK